METIWNYFSFETQHRMIPRTAFHLRNEENSNILTFFANRRRFFPRFVENENNNLVACKEIIRVLWKYGAVRIN